MSDSLLQKRCVPCEGGIAVLDAAAIGKFIPKLDSRWQVENEKLLTRKFSFKNYYHTMAFVNAVAWMAHTEDHHPDMVVTFNYCIIHYSTHAIGGLSENDFICAAKADEIFREYRR